MIHTQRPGATACASYEVWNDTMRRYVRRGAKDLQLFERKRIEQMHSAGHSAEAVSYTHLTLPTILRV